MQTIWTDAPSKVWYNLPHMNAKNLLVVAVPALICGALLGYLIRPAAPAAAPSAPEARAERPGKKVKHVADDAALERLRARIQELERQLAAKDAPAEETRAEGEQQPPPPQQAGRDRPRGPWNAEQMRAHFEEMRKNDPERYAAMTNGWAQHRARSIERAQGKLDILAAVDVSRLNPKQRAVHEQYQDLIARREEVREMMDIHNPNVTDEQRDAAFKEMREVSDKLHALAQTEREALLSHTARSFGVKGEAAKELVDTVKAVYQATESWGGWGGPGGRHGGGRGPGGGRR